MRRMYVQLYIAFAYASSAPLGLRKPLNHHNRRFLSPRRHHHQNPSLPELHSSVLFRVSMTVPSSQSPPLPNADAQKDPAVDSAPTKTAANSVQAETAINSTVDLDDADAGAVEFNADSDFADSGAGDAEAVDSTAVATAAIANLSAAEAENAPALVIRMKPPPSSWTQQETITVVQAYGERWYANKRKPIKGNQWEDIAALVASRGGSRSAGQNPKTPIQCRHKIDKLRKRFRAERHRGSSWNWQYYDLMNRLERGPHPPPQALPSATHHPTPTSRYSVKNDADNGFQGNLVEILDDDSGGDNMEDEDDENQCSKSRSIHYILRRPTMVNRFPGEMTVHSSRGFGVSGLPPNPTLQRIKAETDADADREKLEEEKERRRVVSELASEIRLFAESYVGVENVRMEMMKEGEKRRMEMESKRMGMILDSQKRIAETIAKTFF